MWKDRTKMEKALIALRLVISVVVMVAAIIQIFGIYDKAINLAVPMVGALLIVQSIQDWKTNRGVALFGICSAIFIFICSFVVFFVK